MGGSSCYTAYTNVHTISWGDTSSTPENSTHDRTVDQQCTVTRPGLDRVLLAMSVVILVALLHHLLGTEAPYPALPKPALEERGGDVTGEGIFYPILREGGGTGALHHHCWDPTLTKSRGCLSPK